MKMQVKNKKIKAFYVDVIKAKPNVTKAKHYIHTEASGGFWYYVRDQKLTERLMDDIVGHEICMIMVMGYNEEVIDKWDKLILEDSKGNTYKIKTKPDEYEHNKDDIKIMAYQFTDEDEYGGTTVYGS